jgi:hypothetical protein
MWRAGVQPQPEQLFLLLQLQPEQFFLLLQPQPEQVNIPLGSWLSCSQQIMLGWGLHPHPERC